MEQTFDEFMKLKVTLGTLDIDDIRVTGRNTQGVRVINLEKRGDTISSVCPVGREDAPDEAAEDVEAKELTEGTE